MNFNIKLKTLYSLVLIVDWFINVQNYLNDDCNEWLVLYSIVKLILDILVIWC